MLARYRSASWCAIIATLVLLAALVAFLTADRFFRASVDVQPDTHAALGMTPPTHAPSSIDPVLSCGIGGDGLATAGDAARHCRH